MSLAVFQVMKLRAMPAFLVFKMEAFLYDRKFLSESEFNFSKLY
jgi:hypothetical protein